MTIICYKNGVMAADGGGFWNEVVVKRDRRKIVRTPHGVLMAATGARTLIVRFHNWAMNQDVATLGALDGVHVDGLMLDVKDADEFEGLIALPDGQLFNIDFQANVFRLDVPMVAMGAPSTLAYGAMLAGASAEEAVRICVANHAFAAGDVQVERLEFVDEETGPGPTDEEAVAALTGLGFEADGRAMGPYARWREEHGLS